MIDDWTDVIRLVNLVLLLLMSVGIVIMWVTNRRRPVDPLGIALFVFALSNSYATLETLLTDAGGGQRSLIVLGSILIGNVCVWLPLHQQLRSRNTTD